MIIAYQVQYKNDKNKWLDFSPRHTMYRDARLEFDAIKQSKTYKAVRILEIEESDEIINEWSIDDEKN